MQRLMKYLPYILPIVSLGILSILFMTTDPVSIGPGGILIVFVLIYILCASVMFILLRTGIMVAAQMISRAKGKSPVQERSWRLSVQKAYYVASVVAFAPVLLLAMQSVSQLQLGDIALVAVLMSLAVFYILKRSV